MSQILIVLLVLASCSIFLALMILFVSIGFAKNISLNIPGSIESHKKCINYFLLSLIPPVVIVTIIEVITRQPNEKWGDNVLLIVHLISVFLFLLSIFGMRVVWTGVKNPKIHRMISNYFFLFFLSVAITGAALIIKIFTGK